MSNDHKQRCEVLERHVVELKRRIAELEGEHFAAAPTVERADQLLVRAATIADASEDAGLMVKVAESFYKRLGIIGGKLKLELSMDQFKAHVDRFLLAVRNNVSSEQFAKILAELGEHGDT